MCVDIFVNRGEYEIETPGQLEKLLGIKAEPHPVYGSVDPDACLCQIDIEAELTKAGIEWTEDMGDYYIEVDIPRA